MKEIMKEINTGMIVIFIAVALAIVIGIVALNKNVSSGIEITIYKSLECGCCEGFITELEKSEFDINIITNQDVSAIKEENGIPLNMQSCHTSFIYGYFIEGHVPIEAINKLLSERPDIDGIAVPGMPSGSAGMPGPKLETITVYAIKDKNYSVFMTI